MEKIKQNTVVEQVMERIKELIASGQYRVGDRLPTEHELAERFGIGRSSMREAIKIFNYLGILESHASKGTFVSDRSHISSEALSWAVLLGGEELDELIEIRAAIELWSAVKLAERFKADPASAAGSIGELEDTIGRMRTAISEGDMDEAHNLDFQFHDVTIASSGNSLFVSIYRTLRAFTLKAIMNVHQDAGVIVALPDNHQRLVEAIRSGSRIIVMDEMQEHIHSTQVKLREVMERRRLES